MAGTGDSDWNRRYTLLNKLGEGGMGAVYRAVDTLNGQTIALKRVTTPADQLSFMGQAATSSSFDTRLALAQEFRILASLRHPHIISVLDYGFDNRQQPYFTMDLLDHPKTVVEAGRDQPLPVKIRLLAQTLQAVAYLHRRGVLHRDLKPANVLVSAGQVKVVDFGLSASREQAEEGTEVVGTLAYIAPEVLMGHPPRQEADLYALGVMAYEMFTGRHPFEHQNVGQLIQLVLSGKPDLSSLLTVDDPAAGAHASDDEYPPELEINGAGGLSLVGIVDRLLAKSPDERYHDAYAVISDLCAATDQPVPLESAAIRESFLQAARFVGRDDELKILETALYSAIEGQGSAWLIGGEVGVGKSRLLDELRVRALVRGAVVLRGQAVLEGGVAYQLWREPLRRLVLESEISDLDAGILKDLVPDIDTLLRRTIPPAVELDGTAYQQRLLGTIANLFQHRTRPILLLLEDLQWSTESLEVLRLLNGIASNLPLLIVGTYRHDERPALPDELPGMNTLRLERLSPDSIAALSVSMLGEPGKQPELLTLLQRETEGNVFFLVEVVRALAEEAGQLQNVGRISLPRSVMAGGIQAIVQRRLSRVPDEERDLLQRAAVLGREQDLAVLEHLKGTLNLMEWLMICANCAVLEIQDGVWRFSHDKLRQAMLDAIPAETRAALHREVAEAIEAAYPASPERAPILAQHWRSAADPEKELFYAQRAGEYTLHTSAFADAVMHFRRALELLAAPAPSLQNARADLLLKLGETLKYTGDYETAAGHLEEALSLRRALGDQQGIAHLYVELGDLVTYQGDYNRAAQFCEDSLALYRQFGHAQGIARALDRLCMVRFHQGDYTAATALGEESLGLSRANNDSKGIASAINNLGLIAFVQGDYDGAAHYFTETLAICRESGERRKAATALLNLGSTSGQKGDHDDANHYFEQALAIFNTIGERRGIAMTLDNLGVIAEFQANYSRALYYFEQSLEMARAIGNRRGVATTLLNLGNVTRAQGDPSRARAFYEQALRQAQEIEAVPTLLETLVGLCSVINEPERAAEWLGLALNHPATYEATRQVAEPILQKLKETLSADTLENHFERGKSLNLNEVVFELLDAASP